ncbi:uncharacterized protein LOC110262726 [Arachis ipaensis]|uniref:uncharacterized protein LOC110262726 n=1 Tax=Arachis ipaensis TaxID=130454 RepID=UPI000A2B189F|nr:uncharacterized protein LOC110262726 [Arachis ipaensis]
MYVKVRSVPEEFPFYLNEFLVEKFPLSWCSEPVQALDVDDRSVDDQLVMEFLFEKLGPKGLLSVSELLKWDSDREAVLRYLGEKVPTITTAGLKSFFNQRKKAEKESSATNADKGPVIQPEAALKSKRKRGFAKEKFAEAFLKEGESSVELQ